MEIWKKIKILENSKDEIMEKFAEAYNGSSSYNTNIIIWETREWDNRRVTTFSYYGDWNYCIKPPIIAIYKIIAKDIATAKNATAIKKTDKDGNIKIQHYKWDSDDFKKKVHKWIKNKQKELQKNDKTIQ